MGKGRLPYLGENFIGALKTDQIYQKILKGEIHLDPRRTSNRHFRQSPLVNQDTFRPWFEP